MSRTTIATWLVASAVATASGPFGTFTGMDFGARAVFWFSLVGASILVAILIKAAIRSLLPRMSEIRETLVFAPLLALIFTPLLHAVVQAVAGDADPGMHFVEMAAVVLVSPFAVLTVRRAISAPVPELFRTAGGEPRILRRLPEASGRRILRISVRDHYVDVVTDRKQETFLMRFSDAISEAEGIPGLRVHRSHWVAEDAVSSVERENGRMYLTLVDGSRVPVSRGYRDAVEGAGLGDRAA